VPGTGGPLTLELLAWISERPQKYPETVEVWQTTYPSHSVRRVSISGFCCYNRPCGQENPSRCDRHRSRTITANWQIKVRE